ncbi:hypothetical protein ACFQE1_07995, partial [Halobium palmae]
MSGGPESGELVTTATGGVTVEKTFEAEEFPVPAVKFVLSAEGEETVTVRLTDRIPESFPMKRVGFHPEFEGENWTAFKDQRVEYVRELDPGESVTTVYGVRLDGVDADEGSFLGDPHLDLVSNDRDPEDENEAVEAIVGEDNNQVVRDIVSGERDAVPGMEDDAADAPDLDLDDPLA